MPPCANPNAVVVNSDEHEPPPTTTKRVTRPPPTREELDEINEWIQGKDYSEDDEAVDFTWIDTEEPHRLRRKEILKKYPEIKELYGHEPKTKYIVASTVIIQTFLAIYMRDKSWPYFLAVVYFVGATINHSLFLAIHEWSHNLGFKLPIHNQIGSMFANLPIGIAYASSFKPYHMDHHRNQGVNDLDTDIWTSYEASIIKNNTFLKFVYMSIQLIFYALRPSIIKPLKPNKMLLLNWIIQLSYDGVLVYFFGFNTMLYLLLSTFICGSLLHPTAGHFLSEHLEIIEGIETYSYYGILNWVTYNVGYHNEHHDFPYVAWSRLPQVTKIAGDEYYNKMPHCKSWSGIIYQFITNPKLGAYSRIKRHTEISCVEKVNPNDDMVNDPTTTTYDSNHKKKEN